MRTYFERDQAAILPRSIWVALVGATYQCREATKGICDPVAPAAFVVIKSRTRHSAHFQRKTRSKVLIQITEFD